MRDPFAGKFFAVIDSHSPYAAVYGVGVSPADALCDAVENGLDGPTDSFQIVPCSEGAFGRIVEHGGANGPDLTVRREGVTLREEE